MGNTTISKSQSISEKHNGNWLQNFAHLTLNQICALPGSHNSACTNPRQSMNPAWEWCRTQDVPLDLQLLMGIRVLDLRISSTDDIVHISHRFLSQYTLEMVLDLCVFFLQNHPTEFILLYIRIDSDLKLKNVSSVRQHFNRKDIVLAKPGKLANTLISDLQGSIVLVTPLNVSSYQWPSTMFDGASYCPIWTMPNMDESKKRLDEHILSHQHLVTNFDEFTGIAIDGQFGIMPPSSTSIQLNQWFLQRLSKEWDSHTIRIGIVLLDFVDFKLCNTLISRCHDVLEPDFWSPQKGRNPWKNISNNLCGICHIGSSRKNVCKTVQIACGKTLLPKTGRVVCKPILWNNKDTFSFVGQIVSTQIIELTVTRTDLQAGWGGELFVHWHIEHIIDDIWI